MCKIALTIRMPPHWDAPLACLRPVFPAACERPLQHNLARGVYVIFLLKLSLVALCAQARRRNKASWKKQSFFDVHSVDSGRDSGSTSARLLLLCLMKIWKCIFFSSSSTKSEQINKAAKKRFSLCVPHFVPQKQQHKQRLQVCVCVRVCVHNVAQFCVCVCELLFA